MDLETFAWLRSAPGQHLLADLAARPLDERAALAEIERLRRHYSAAQASAAFEQALLRRRARAKFPHAERLYFTRTALEQASAAPVAAHRAARLAAAHSVADLCCGIGGDALALAAAGAQVTAVDIDPLRLAIVEANAAASGLAGQISAVQRDLLAEAPPAADALFCDPGRRAGDRRRFAVEAYEPPLSHVLSWQRQTPALAVKLAPGVALDALPPTAELEFVSLDGELKEALLWCGPLAHERRRASVLRRAPDGHIHTHTLIGNQHPEPPARLSAPLTWFYEPDPSIIRAGLVRSLAEVLDAAQLDPSIAYLTAAAYRPGPFARAWPVLEWLPFSLKRLSARLRSYPAGPVTIKKRGSPLDSDALARKLSRPGAHPLVVVLTQHAGGPIALLCGPPAVDGV